MNTTLKYLAVIAAFAAGALAFVAGSTWVGVLAVASGILTAITIIRKDEK